MVYLISWDDVEKILEMGESRLEMWENSNLDYDLGGWITHNTLLQIRKTGLKPRILAKAENLPVFFGPLETPYKEYYCCALTAICLSRPDGSTIRGISYLTPYDDYWFCRELGRCFRYGYHDDPQHYWRVIGHFGDVDWLLGYWGEEYGFSEWLANLGEFEQT